MAFPQPVLDNINRGKAFYADLNAEYINNLNNGCCGCSVKDYDCLQGILRSLDDSIELDEYDDIAKKLVNDMLIIIGDYTIKIPPTVNAGPDQSVPINEDAFFSALIVPGSAPIVSIQWSIVSGSGTLINSTTANLTVEDFPVAQTVLKIVVKDENGLSAVDTVVLTGTAATMKVYYISKSTNVLPTDAEILAANFVNIVPGSVSYDIPINSGGFNFHFVAQLSTEPNKVRWVDTIDADNNGVIADGNTWYDAGLVTTFDVYGTSFKTEFDNPLRFIS